jgi:hypothetical protein
VHAGGVTPPRRRIAGLALAAAIATAVASPAHSAPAPDPESCLPRPTIDDLTAVLGGTTTDDADWVAAFGIDDRGIQLVCVDIVVEGEDAASGVLGGPFNAPDRDDDIVVSVLTTGRRDGPRWHAVRGTVTEAAERLELSVEGGEPIEADIADIGPEPGWRWYAIVVPIDEPGIPHVTAIAYDADGDVVAEGESPF